MKQENREPVVLAAVDDIFFSTKIEEAARGAGVTLVQALNAEQLADKLAAMTPDLIILDLNSRTCAPLESIAQIKRDAKFRNTQILAFVSHVQVELEQAARDAGCDQVMPRSKFSANLPQILRSVKGYGRSPGP